MANTRSHRLINSSSQQEIGPSRQEGIELDEEKILLLIFRSGHGLRRDRQGSHRRGSATSIYIGRFCSRK